MYKRICDKGVIWNPNCNCECYKSCDVGEYLDYKNCKYRKKIADKLVEVCSENIDENEMTVNSDYEKLCNSCTLYIVLFVMFLIISISISSAFIFFSLVFKKIILNAIPLRQQLIKHVNNNF